METQTQYCCLCTMKAVYSVGGLNSYTVPLLYCEEHFPHWARLLYEENAKLDEKGQKQVVTMIGKEVKK